MWCAWAWGGVMNQRGDWWWPPLIVIRLAQTNSFMERVYIGICYNVIVRTVQCDWS